MVTQPRALRTRRTLVCAAAAQVDRYGYHGTTLLRVCRAADISMGALTFHFPTKGQLADALQERGRAMTLTAVHEAVVVPASPLRQARALVLSMARLLEKETEVRAAARLSRERNSSGTGWTGAWLPHLSELLDQAHADGQLRAEADPETVTMMGAYLIVGAEAHLRHRAHAGAPNDPTATDTVGQLARVWDLILYGISATELPRPQNAQHDEETSAGF